jgi:mycothiol conjugate amidase Mca
MVDNERLCLMAVHAHPDDECIGTGIALARYAAAGVHTVLVTCTLGEEGEILDPRLDPDEARPRLAQIREGELRCSAATLGVRSLHVLGYRDSGMAGMPSNQHPDAFNNVRFTEAVSRLVEIVRRERPQVLVTYNENGGYGHPDHIMAHFITVGAFFGAADSRRFPVSGPDAPPWQPRKLYYTAFPRERLAQLRAILRARGLSDPWEQRERRAQETQQDATAPAQQDAWQQAIGLFQSEAQITTWIKGEEYYPQKRASMLCHPTQMTPDSFFLNLPEDIAPHAYGTEAFVLAQSLVPTERPEDDLFAGLR